MRFIVAALLIANLGFYAWTQGWLDDVVGVRAEGEREPERLARQVHPELIRSLSPAETAASGAASGVAGTAGPGGPSRGRDGSGLPAGGPVHAGGDRAGRGRAGRGPAAPAAARYANLRSEQPGVWLVYMGRFANLDGVRQKEEELGRIHIAYEELLEPSELAPGLSLGRYDSKAAAEAALNRLVQRGVRTGRVAQLVPPGIVHSLRVEHADAALKAQLTALADPLFATRRFEPCANAPAAAAAGLGGIGRRVALASLASPARRAYRRDGAGEREQPGRIDRSAARVGGLRRRRCAGAFVGAERDRLRHVGAVDRLGLLRRPHIGAGILRIEHRLLRVEQPGAAGGRGANAAPRVARRADAHQPAR